MAMNPDTMIGLREEDQTSKDIKQRRRFESELNQYLAAKRKEGYKIGTLQVMFASIRSFFEIHYCPLIMRKGDFPKGASDGVKRATDEAIRKALNVKARNRIQNHALIHFTKDTGLRISDVVSQKCGDIPQQIENGVCPIQVNIITEKTSSLAKTFIGKEAIDALKEYFNARKQGSRKWHKNVPPETITADSPLFRTWTRDARPLSRSSASGIIRNAFVASGEKRMSAHSLRKRLQTKLEKGGMPTNWIDQVLGHELINSRDAYSLPTDEELKEAYSRAYNFVKVKPETETEHIHTIEEKPQALPPILQATEEAQAPDVIEIKANDIQTIKQALLKGYRHADTVGDIRLYLRS
jgi:site-specific recombinase XerD